MKGSAEVEGCPFLTWSEIDLLTGTIYGEARGEPWGGKVAVGMTVRERVRYPGHWKWGRNWREVMLAPEQFSCWGDHNRAAIITAREKQLPPRPRG